MTPVWWNMLLEFLGRKLLDDRSEWIMEWIPKALLPTELVQKKHDKDLGLKNRRLLASAFPSTGMESGASPVTCIVCLEGIAEKELHCKLACSHSFHEDCILTWWTRKVAEDLTNVECPMCRESYKLPTQEESPDVRATEEAWTAADVVQTLHLCSEPGFALR
eukprot:CAMPEP_0195101192 /NCGR_PEP_ID=MMETSP0448-20130528/64963_1 /TAXON_ID=66468 /ORGANISM="Heterocapsa triquestra, Strain CCMP 448" /LENGTH=162 /DNA_ID=CAMNT_0040136457 /DNA_START=198 /DNA_END=686 /DNA_ORIENTATION=+